MRQAAMGSVSDHSEESYVPSNDGNERYEVSIPCYGSGDNYCGNQIFAFVKQGKFFMIESVR